MSVDAVVFGPLGPSVAMEGDDICRHAGECVGRTTLPRHMPFGFEGQLRDLDAVEAV